MNTVMNDEHIVRLQSNVQFLLTRLPIIVLQKVDEHVPAFRETMVTVMCVYVCRQLEYVILFWGFVWPKERNVFHFLWFQILRMILTYVGLNVLCSFRGHLHDNF
jgi:hypothetical protein